MKFLIATLLVGLFLCTATTSSIQAQSMPNYTSFLNKGEKKVSSNYVQIVSKMRSGVHIVRTFYPERLAITLLRTYKTADREVLHGPYKHYDDHGKLKIEGNYKNGEQIGVWKSYNTETGTLSDEEFYEAGLKEGIHKRYYENGQLSRTTTWKAGKKQGAFTVYDEDGSIYNKGTYENDEIAQQDKLGEEEKPAYLEANKEGNYAIVEQMPRFPGCEEEEGDNNDKKACADQKLLKFIYKNIKYPSVARMMQVEGMVVMSFIVYEDGHVGDINTLRGVCQSMEEECIRVLEMMPEWTPGQQKGEPVRVQYNIPIRFKLN